MSSIFGLLHYRQKPVEQAHLQLMLQALNHWNADDTGVWNNDATGLGHLMLYNTPESLQERLPFYDALSRLSITADARIDNRAELCKKLEIAASQQFTIADSTLILKCYEKYGINCAQHLTGDFAFAIWDEPKKQLFCARDQMGVKPFFYYNDSHFFAFASEKKGLLVLPSLDKTINKQFLYNQLIFPPEQAAETTLYKNILRLPPAHTLVINIADGSFSMNEYWTLDAFAEIKLVTTEDYYEGLLYHFEEAVKCRTRTAYPIAAEVSGGLDSSAITGVAQTFLKQGGQELMALSNTLPAEITDPFFLKMDEKIYIEEVIRFNNIQHYTYITEPGFDSLMEEIELSLLVNDGLERTNMRWQLALKKKAFELNIRTLLSGFPGDQMVTSLAKNYTLDFLDKKQYLRYLLTPAKMQPGFNKWRPFVPDAVTEGLKSFKNRLGFYEPAIKRAAELYNIPAAYMAGHKQELKKNRLFNERFMSYRHAQKRILLKPETSQRMESETRYGLHFRLEPRFPMADIRLTQFYSAMPNSLKYEGPVRRKVFTESVKKYLPPGVLHKNDKSGSVNPFALMHTAAEFALIEELLARIQSNPLLKTDNIRKIFPDNATACLDREAAWHTVIRLPKPELLLWLDRNGID